MSLGSVNEHNSHDDFQSAPCRATQPAVWPLPVPSLVALLDSGGPSAARHLVRGTYLATVGPWHCWRCNGICQNGGHTGVSLVVDIKVSSPCMARLAGCSHSSREDAAMDWAGVAAEPTRRGHDCLASAEMLRVCARSIGVHCVVCDNMRPCFAADRARRKSVCDLVCFAAYVQHRH